MVVLDPVSLGVAGLGFGLNLLGNNANANKERQDYLNAKAYQDATSRFNNWQASFNAKNRDADSQYQYWRDTVNYNQQRAYTASMRNYDLAQEANQAQTVFENRVGAGVNYVTNSQALADRYAEEGMSQAVALQQARYRTLQNTASYQAGMQEGNSSDRIVNDFARQMGDYETLLEINQGLRNRQYKRDQLGQVINYLNQYNSQDFYEAQERWDPIAPFAPLPTLVMPPGPRLDGAAPPTGIRPLQLGSALLGGVNTYMDTAGQIKRLAEG